MDSRKSFSSAFKDILYRNLLFFVACVTLILWALKHKHEGMVFHDVSYLLDIRLMLIKFCFVSLKSVAATPIFSQDVCDSYNSTFKGWNFLTLLRDGISSCIRDCRSISGFKSFFFFTFHLFM